MRCQTGKLKIPESWNLLYFMRKCCCQTWRGCGTGLSGIYRKSDILNGYIVPEYEVLHTQSREYIVEDILDVMKERGVEI